MARIFLICEKLEKHINGIKKLSILHISYSNRTNKSSINFSNRNAHGRVRCTAFNIVFANDRERKRDRVMISSSFYFCILDLISNGSQFSRWLERNLRDINI